MNEFGLLGIRATVLRLLAGACPAKRVGYRLLACRLGVRTEPRLRRRRGRRKKG